VVSRSRPARTAGSAVPASLRRIQRATRREQIP
jgi:hypothetical protein